MRGRAGYGACRGVRADRGPGRAGGVPCLRREPGRSGEARRCGSRSGRRSPCPTWPRRRARSGWPGPTCPATSTWTATCTRRWPGWPRIQRTTSSAAERLQLLRQLGGPRVLLPRIPPPPQEVRVRRRSLMGRRHSKGRDASAISHHYDVSNTFYEWVLGPSMAYTCACYPSEDATLEEAQAYKHDLVARKLGAAPGDAAARRGLRLGRHGHARGPRVRRQGPRRHAVRAAGAVGAAGDRGAGPVRTWPRSGTSTTGT